MERDDEDWWQPAEPLPDFGRRGEVRLRLPARRRRAGAADPRSRRQPDGVHGLSRTYDPGTHRWTRPGLDRPAAGRRRHLRAARRHVHPRGHLDRGHRPAGPPGARSASTSSRCMPVNAFNGDAQLGLRRRAVVRGAGGVRRPGGVPGVRRRLPPARARRHPGRRLQPPRAERQLPAGVRARTCTPAAPTPGASRSTWTARTPTRSAATSSTTP